MTLVMSMLILGIFIFMGLLTMEDQLVLDFPDLIDLLLEEASITSELEVLEVLPTLLAVCFLEIFLNLLKVLLDDTTAHPSS